jgi:hypothetical protein
VVLGHLSAPRLGTGSGRRVRTERDPDRRTPYHPYPDAAGARSLSSPALLGPLLRELAAQLDHGAIYDRHLVAIALAVEQVERALR